MSGLEVIGSIASVAQLAGVVYSISKQLYEVGEALSYASSDITDLAHDLEIFSEELLLHATLVNAGNSRYSDQVNRLTAKIIGRCATICLKIDHILKKLRKGGVWAKLKWLYKEKELKKLLERLRDLKLSLMGTLSHLRSLRADYLMDALGVAKLSLLKGDEDEKMSKETIEDIEETRRKLAEVSMSQELEFTVARTALRSQSSSGSHESAQTTNVDSFQSQGSQNDFSSRSTFSTQLNSVISVSPEATELYSTTLTSAVALSENLGINQVLQNPSALESVQSFHSALSYQTNVNQDTPSQSFKSQVIDDMDLLRAPDSEVWRAEMVRLAIKHFSIPLEDARTWASSLPKPIKEQVPPHSSSVDWLSSDFNLFEMDSHASTPLEDINFHPRIQIIKTSNPPGMVASEGQGDSYCKYLGHREDWGLTSSGLVSNDSATSTPGGSEEITISAPKSSATTSNFQAVRFSTRSGSSHRRTSSQAQLIGAESQLSVDYNQQQNHSFSTAGAVEPNNSLPRSGMIGRSSGLDYSRSNHAFDPLNEAADDLFTFPFDEFDLHTFNSNGSNFAHITPPQNSGVFSEYPANAKLSSSPIYAEAPQYELFELRAVPSNYSTALVPSASSKATGSPHSTHEHIVPGLEYTLGSSPALYDDLNYVNFSEYKISSAKGTFEGLQLAVSKGRDLIDHNDMGFISLRRRDSRSSSDEAASELES